MRKKIFTFLLALVTSVGLSWAQNPSGSCGTNLSWEFNPATGTLTITGSGAMTDWASANSRPWHSYQSDITSLSLPEGLTFIGRSAFQECQMTSVELPNSLEEIGRAAFCACGLTSVTIPDNVQTIGQSAFASCQNLSTITIGSGVTSIGYFAFSNLMIEPWPSRKLESVTCYATTPPTCGFDESFTELWDKEQVPLYVPAESVAAYSAAEDWNGFDVQAISGGSTPSGDEGKLLGAFTINSNGDQIVFSKGNLQYHCTNHVWQFATNQYDIIGGDNANISDSYDGWIDLFGYGTGNNPTLVSTSYGDYSTFTDWGVNAISNGGNEANQWRTLTAQELVYMFLYRTEAHNKYGAATVANVPGIIVLPDVYVGPAVNTVRDAWDNNVISSSEWAAYEAAGAVFLPAAGYRSGTTMDNVGLYGFCWSSTPDPGDAEYSYKLSLSPNTVQPQGFGLRYEGLSVRLVKAASAQDIADVVIALINAIPNPVAYNDECKDAIDAARAAYDALTDAQKDLVENYGDLLDAETAYAQSIPHPNGECGAQGNNLLWDLDPSTGVLTITGSGAMNDWPYDTDLPWYDNRLQITSVVLPSGITSIGTKAFRGCNNLASINMTENYPAGLTAINQEAFCNTKLTSVTIPESVVTIGMDAFYLSQAITDVYCYADPNNLTWNDYYRDDFKKTPAKSTQCHVKNCHLDVFNTNWNTGNSTDVNVTFVGDLPGECGAPANSCGDGLTWELNAGVLTISYDGVGTGVMDDWGGYNEAPWSSEKLQITSVVLPEGITTIGSAAFRGCTNLASVNMAENFPASLTTIKTEAFYNSALTSVTIPANVVSIYSNVFYGCQSIANVYCYANPNDLVWMDGYCDDFKSGNKITQCHVKNCYLSLYNTKWNTGYELTDVNVTFVGDLPGDCGSSTFIDADFAINFMNDPYIVVGGGDLPEGVLVEGIPNKDLNHGYYNVIITIPAKAGTYKVTLGTCGFGLGNGTIQNENGSTTYASFNQHLADNDLCYHQDPTNNIVTAIFTLPEDQNIIVDCGEYTPYFSIEASSAPAPSFIDADFAIDFRHNPYEVVGGGSLPTGVEVSGTPNGDISHGYTGAIITIPVTAGNYKVTMGTCTYSNHDGFVKTEDGSHTYATLATNNGTCYHQNTATNVVSKIFNVPTDQIIKVHGAEYTPYFAIEKMAAVPAFTDFEINFRTEPYSMISGAKPEGTVIAGSFHDGDHGYQNVEVTVPMEAGTYRLTMGACQFGNGAGNVMSAANAELASFNQNLGENKCYHQNPANNIVSMIFTVDIDQTITIDCGEYTPYMKLEKITEYHVIFALGDAEGSAPAAVNVTIGEDLTMPVNKTIYKDGYTLTGWSDGVNTYPIGESFTPANDVVLTPVFSANAVAITDATEEVSVRWYFGKSNEAPDFAWQNNSGFLVAQAIIGGNPIDVRLDINATAGKFSNEGRDDKWAQVNATTILSFPGKEDAVVAVETYNNNPEHYAINATAGTLTCNTNDYYSYLEIVYPAPAPAPTTEDVVTNPDPENPTYHYSTFFHSTQNYALTDDGTQAFVADLSNDELVLTMIAEGTQVIPANTAVILRKTGSNEPVALAPTDEPGVSFTANNDLEGVDVATTLESLSIDPQKCYVLSGKSHDETAEGVGFYRIYGNTLKAHKAYVIYNGPVNSNLAPKRMRFVFNNEQTATGVESVQNSDVRSQKVLENGVLYIIRDGVRYNVQGQIVK